MATEPETRYQRITREQRERQAARAMRMDEERAKAATDARKRRRWANEARRERAYEDWCTSDFPNQPDN